jgi:hypothetical protein
VLREQGVAGGSNPDDGAAVPMFGRDQPAIDGVFPNWKSRARGTPRLHHFFISSFANGERLDQIQNKGFEGVWHAVLTSTISWPQERAFIDVAASAAPHSIRPAIASSV